MNRIRSTQPSRPARSVNGCTSLLLWLGAVINLVLIAWSYNAELPIRLPFAVATASINAAARALEQGNFAAAISQSGAAFTQNPENTTALLILVRAMIYQSYVDFVYDQERVRALELTERALLPAETRPDVLAAHAFALQANGEAVLAVDFARQALALQPDHALAQTALALAYARAGSFDVALRESQQARADDRDAFHLDATRAVAISTADLGNYLEAGAVLDEALLRYERFIPLHFERALYALQLGDADRATVAYYTVLSLDPGNVKAQLRLCEVSSNLRESQRALELCAQVTQQAPELPEGWYRLGREHFLSGRFQEAQTALHQCSSLQVRQNVPPEQRIFECWYLQGQAAEILGDCRALVATYNQFRIMAANSNIRETWTYPPEGPPACSTPDN